MIYCLYVLCVCVCVSVSNLPPVGNPLPVYYCSFSFVCGVIKIASIKLMNRRGRCRTVVHAGLS